MRSVCLKQSLATRSLALLMAASCLAMAPLAHAQEWYKKPMARQAAIGAAAGVAAGALSDRMSVGKGALTGAVVGAGTGYMSQNNTLATRPLLRQTLKGALVGVGVGYAADYNVLKGGLIGAGSGAGYHYVRKYVLDK